MKSCGGVYGLGWAVVRRWQRPIRVANEAPAGTGKFRQHLAPSGDQGRIPDLSIRRTAASQLESQAARHSAQPPSLHSPMDRDQIKTTFDRQAATYDQQWSKLVALRDCLHLLLGSVFATLPPAARILCVGAGTGAEIPALAERYPGWFFTAVEPSPAMLSACRERAEAQGYAQRLPLSRGLSRFAARGPALRRGHQLPRLAVHPEPAGTLRLLPRHRRTPSAGGLLASSDLASDLTSAAQQEPSRGLVPHHGHRGAVDGGAAASA